MRQFIGMIGRPVPEHSDLGGDDLGSGSGATADRTLAEFALSLAPATLSAAGERLAAAERAMLAAPHVEKAQLAYANALHAWGEAGGYDVEVLFDTVATTVMGKPWDEVRDRLVGTLSGGQQKRFALELLLRGSDEVLLLDEPDNFLDVPAKRWLEERLRESPKSVLYVSHDRELLARTADRVVAVEGGSAWTHPAGFESWHEARLARHEKLEERRRRWDEEHEKIRQLMLMYKQKAAYNADMASRYQAAQTRLRKFEESGPPPLPPKDQNIRMNLAGGRTGKRAVMCEQLELENLTFPFDTEIWYGDRVAVLGANGTGKSHFLRLLARGGTDPDPAVVSPESARLSPVAASGSARLGARVVPGHFSQTHDRPDLVGRTLVEILWRGDDRRPGRDRPAAMHALGRYELAGQGDQRFETLSGGQQARFLVLLLELGGATLLLLDEPTDNLDLASAEALEVGLAQFEGTVIAVTHDRWFTRSFDRYLLFGGDGEVTETTEPVFDVR
jgi:ATPase subunit of ABC transporter with duplicated ATPase domains